MNHEAQIANEIVDAEVVLLDSSADPQVPRTSIVERVLSPQNLHRMMLSGGGLLVAGFVVWLWSIGIFGNALIVAFAVGGVNLSLLIAGIWLSEVTRYKIAGRGLTMLSSLVMPLNLWLYDSQGLISLDAGGQLWIPALVCCIVYAVVARVTRDSLFVYTLVGGVVLTGMLFLAGAPGSVFWTVLPMSTFLIAVGSIAIQADRCFTEPEGAFSRARFGLAFFRSGQIVLISGLAVLLGGQLASPAAEMFLSDQRWSVETPEIMFSSLGKLWSLALLIAAGCSFVFSNLTIRKSQLNTIFTTLVGAWATFNAISLLNIELTVDLGILMLGIVVVAANLSMNLLTINRSTTEHSATDRNTTRFLTALALVLISISTVRFGVTTAAAEAMFNGWISVAQLCAVSVALLTLPGLWRGNNPRIVSEVYMGIGVAGLTIALVSMLSGFGVASIAAVLSIVSVIVLATSMTTVVSIKSEFANRHCTACTSAGLALPGLWAMMLLNGFGVSFDSVFSMFLMATLAASFALCGFVAGRKLEVALSIAAVSTAVVQIFVHFHLTSPDIIISIVSSLGLAILAAGKFIERRRDQALDAEFRGSGADQLLEQSGNSILLLGAVSAVLFSVFAIFEDRAELSQLGLLAFQLVSLCIGAFVTKHKAWKQAFATAGFASIGTGVIVLSTISTLTILQRVEVVSLVFGATAVIAGYFGWSREKSEEDEMVTASLFFGSLLLVVPMIFGILFDRMDGGEILYSWRILHEVGGLVAGLLLLGSGILCRIRSTTLSGSVLLAVYVLSNLLLINFPEQLQNTSVLMMIGGAAFFATALLLSVYRDRLIGLPEKVRKGKGVFSVLKWR